VTNCTVAIGAGVAGSIVPVVAIGAGVTNCIFAIGASVAGSIVAVGGGGMIASEGASLAETVTCAMIDNLASSRLFLVLSLQSRWVGLWWVVLPHLQFLNCFVVPSSFLV